MITCKRGNTRYYINSIPDGAAAAIISHPKDQNRRHHHT